MRDIGQLTDFEPGPANLQVPNRVTSCDLHHPGLAGDLQAARAYSLISPLSVTAPIHENQPGDPGPEGSEDAPDD